MVDVTVQPTPEIIVPTDSPANQRVTLCNVTWEAYEKILEALGDHRSARLTYDNGLLEIMVPLEPHERSNRRIEDVIKILVDELDLTIKTIGSTTLNRADLRKGSEPDSCYYLKNEPLVRDKEIDLNQDPPPDLILEVDITHSDIDKLNLYAQMGTPEFWRYNGKILKIYQLVDSKYQEVETSPAFPWVTKEDIYRFLRQCSVVGEAKARNELRAWVREHREQWS